MTRQALRGPLCGGVHVVLFSSTPSNPVVAPAIWRGGAEVRIGRVYALSGRRREAQKALDELKGMSKQSYVPPYNMALISDGLGQKEQAIAWLEKAMEADGPRFGLKMDPTWDRLRSHPGFQDLLRRVGLGS